MSKYVSALDLCNYAKNAVGCGYCYGSKGEVCTLARREAWAMANPSQKENLLGICAKWDGMRVWDCSGIFRGAWESLWQYKSGGATTIYTKWCTGQKGAIGTLPDMPGIAVFRDVNGTKEHIGLYVGDGMGVDARGSSKGVLIGTLASYPSGWTHWAMLDDVDYENSLPSVGEITALWTGYVKTKTGGGISLWVSNAKNSAMTKIPESVLVDILGDPDELGFAQARYNGRMGVVDTQYVIPMDGEEPAQDTYRGVVTGVNVGLNLRTSPQLVNNTILLIPGGKEVEVFPALASGSFAYVQYAGLTGYCTASYIKQVAGEVV